MFAWEVYNQEQIMGRENSRDETSIEKKTDRFIHLVTDMTLNFR